MKRAPFTVLMIFCLTLLTTGCTEPEPDPAPQVTYTAAEREWFLSSLDQQAAYCSAYGRGDDSLKTVRYYGFGDEDADEEFVEDFLKLLKEKC